VVVTLKLCGDIQLSYIVLYDMLHVSYYLVLYAKIYAGFCY
jgi:hypothetical protein